MSRPRLTTLEIEALLAAAGNIDPCMFHEGENEKEGERQEAAWLSGLEKLRVMLAGREKRIGLLETLRSAGAFIEFFSTPEVTWDHKPIPPDKEKKRK